MSTILPEPARTETRTRRARKGLPARRKAGLVFGYTALAEVRPFSLLSDERLRTLYQASRHCRYHRGAAIRVPGECPTGVYILLAGRAEALMEDAQGRAMTLFMIERKELFGNLSLFGEGERCTGIRALENCEMLYIPRPAYLACIEGNYDAAVIVLHLVEQRLRKAHMKIATLGLLPVYERVARLLIESAQQVNGQWIVETGAEEIARKVAASREMVSRVVKSMNERGLVRRDRRKTVILDWQSMSTACRPCESGAAQG